MLSGLARAGTLGRAAVPSMASRLSPTIAAPAVVNQRFIQTSAPRQFMMAGQPFMYTVQFDKPWDPSSMVEYEVMPRDEFGVPAHIPPDLSSLIQHTYYVPPQFYPFLKKMGDSTPDLKPYMDMLIKGEMTFYKYEEMFYRSAQPIKIFRGALPMPYRSEVEVAKSPEVEWEGTWQTYRQKVAGDLLSLKVCRMYVFGCLLMTWTMYIWYMQINYYREDMRLFYLEAPEHKINWVVPRGDL